jgi:molybdopterin adenylyltransferase
MGHSAPDEHKAQAPKVVICAVITISDTRTTETDKSGDVIREALLKAGHQVAFSQIVKDEVEQIRTVIDWARDHKEARVAILTGGTGLTARDSTFEVVSEKITRPLPGFGELFRMLSYEEIGAAAMMSRATAGVYDSLFIFALPGSSNAVRLGMDKLIVPEIGHIMEQLSR